MTRITIIIKRLGAKGVATIAACIAVLAIAYFGFGSGAASPKKSANASAPANLPPATRKPVQTMNLALGNMVVLAHELGFTVMTAKETPAEHNKIALRIESHLQRLREIYRQESGKNAALVGSMSLRFDIAPSGEVSQVSELSSRINDAAFKSTILAEVAKWSFTDIVAEPLTVTCPLLFVREGMDITSLVQWEKAFAVASENSAPSRPAPPPAPAVAVKVPPTIAVKTAPAVAVKVAPVPTPPPGPLEFQIKYSTSLRRQPDFSSPSLMVIPAGAKVAVVNKAGDWIEVRLAAGQNGFIRKEFVKPVEVASE